MVVLPPTVLPFLSHIGAAGEGRSPKRPGQALRVVLVLTWLAATGGSTHSSPIPGDSRAASGVLAPASSPFAQRHGADKASLLAAFGQLPLSFEANWGQSNAEVKFLSRGRGYQLFLTPAGAALMTTPSAELTADADRREAMPAILRMRFLGSNPHPKLVSVDELPGKSNYFIGDDPKQWRTGIPHYARVKYEGIYPGIDLVFYGNQRQLEYDFIVGPGADPEAIQLRFEGAKRISLDVQGNLVLHTANGDVQQHKPRIYQEFNGIRRTTPGGYVLKGKHQVAFRVDAYDPSRPLVIDPVLSFSTYLGGSSADEGFGIAVDVAGKAYVTGSTGSVNFPTSNPVQATFRGVKDAFVAKIDPTGSALVYATYLGGDLDDQGRAIAVDAAGNAYVTGFTSSTNFPTVNPLQATNGGAYDAFVAKIDPTGSTLVYSTYLGGSGDETFFSGGGIAVDTLGNAYVTGSTTSVNFPTVNALQAALRGVRDAFVAKLNATGSAFVYSTYLGGSDDDQARSIAVDAAGSAYVAGTTFSADFPTASALQPAFGGARDAFVTKLNPAGSALVYSTYLGGSATDEGYGIAVDASGNVYVTGFTQSTNFPTVGPVQAVFGGFFDAFVTKINASGSALIYSTYLGGSSDDRGLSIAVDSAGSAYVTGFTSSANFPTTAGAFQATSDSVGLDAFVIKLNAPGSALVYSTYLGGSSDDRGLSIAVDSAGSAYVIGDTSSSDFPRTNPLQVLNAGGPDAFIAKITEAAATTADLTLTNVDAPDPVMVGGNLTYTITVTNNGPDAATGVLVTDPLPSGVTFVSSTTSQGTCTGASTVTCALGTINAGSSARIDIVVTPTVVATLGNTANVISSVPDPNVTNNSAMSTTRVNAPPVATADLTLTNVDAPDPLTVGGNLTYTITVTNNGPDAATGVLVTDPLPSGVTFVSSTTSQGTCTGASTVTCALGTINAGSSARIDIVAMATVVTTLSNTASVSSSISDPDLTNNSRTVSTLVNAPPASGPQADLSVTVTDAPDPVTAGNSVTYMITVTNNGPNVATNVTLSDAILSATLGNFGSAAASQGFCFTALNQCVGFGCVFALGLPLEVTCDLGTLAPGARATANVVVGLPEGTHRNSASVTSSLPDPASANNQATETTTVTAFVPPSGDSGGGGGRGAGCFIATAAFGSPLASEVRVLREFRDRYLLTHALGQVLVVAYDRLSPPLAGLIVENDTARAIVRMALRPPIWWARLVLAAPALALLSSGGVLLAGLILPLTLLRLRRARASQGRSPEA